MYVYDGMLRIQLRSLASTDRNNVSINLVNLAHRPDYSLPDLANFQICMEDRISPGSELPNELEIDKCVGKLSVLSSRRWQRRPPSVAHGTNTGDQSLWKMIRRVNRVLQPGRIAVPDSEKSEALAVSLETQNQPSYSSVIEIVDEALLVYSFAATN